MQNPMIFRPSFGNRPDRIVGRDEEVERLRECLRSFPGSRDRAVLVTGQRGMGKTALLLETADLAMEHGFVPVRTTCGPAMLDNIIDILQRAGSRYIEDKKPPVKGFNAGALGFSFGLTFTEEVREAYGFRVKLEMLCERLEEASRGVAILVDEARGESVEMQQLATAYQELAGDGRNIAIVMAGLPATVSELLGEKTLTFLNRATKVPLGAISTASVRAYYASAFKRENRTIPADVLNEAARATEGFPYFLQLLGYYLVCLTGDGDTIDDSILRQAKELAWADLDEDVFKAMLRPLTRADLAFLRAMARDSGITHVGDMEARLGVSQGHVQSYRKRLLEAGVITAPRRGELAFVVPRLADYLRRN